MTALASGLYLGEVIHQRFAPKRHRLRYAMFQMLFDLDEMPTLAGRLSLFSHNRPNLFSFYDRDHGEGGGPVRNWVDRMLRGAGIDSEGGKVSLLCLPRMLGHVFNPLSIYYCRDRGGKLAAMIYEVNNTFGQRHAYVLHAPAASNRVVRQSCAKAFHVSPFLDGDMTYDFAVSIPGGHVATTVRGINRDGAPMIFATFNGTRREISDRALGALFFRYPLMTLKVVAAIHLEAVKLIAKGIRLRPAPAN